MKNRASINPASGCPLQTIFAFPPTIVRVVGVAVAVAVAVAGAGAGAGAVGVGGGVVVVVVVVVTTTNGICLHSLKIATRYDTIVGCRPPSGHPSFTLIFPCPLGDSNYSR